jgi:hypothetical protein
MKELFLFSLGTFFFCLYVEYSIGGIFYRINVEGYKQINIQSGINFLVSPLYQPFLWNRNLLDVNYPLQVLLFSLLYTIFQKLIINPSQVESNNHGYPQSDNL